MAAPADTWDEGAPRMNSRNQQTAVFIGLAFGAVFIACVIGAFLLAQRDPTLARGLIIVGGLADFVSMSIACTVVLENRFPGSGSRLGPGVAMGAVSAGVVTAVLLWILTP